MRTTTLFALCAAAVIAVGCTNVSAFDIEETMYVVADTIATNDTDTIANDTEMGEDNTYFGFNEAEEPQTEADSVEVALYGYALEIVQVHIELDLFVEPIPADLLERLSCCYPDLEDMVEAIRIWWWDDNCYDCLIEYPTMDDFYATVILTKWATLFTED